MADLTIDLAQLGVRNKSSNNMPPQADLESLGSEDEGPADFTLNMEKWMRGTEKWKKEGGRIDEEEDHEERQHGGKSESEKDETADEAKARVEHEESEFMPLSTSTPLQQAAPRDDVPEPRDAADKRSLTKRPSSRLNAGSNHGEPGEEVCNQILALQAKIERLQMEGGNHQLVRESLQVQNSTLRDEVDQLRDELSSMRSSLSKMRQQAKTTNKDRDSEHKSQEDAKSKVDSLRDKFEPLLQELAIARSTAEVEKRHSEAKITALESKLLSWQESLMKQQIDSRCAQEVNNSENLRLRSELDIYRGEAKAYRQTLQTREDDHKTVVAGLQKKLDAVRESQSKADVLKMELDHALEQLTETRRIVDTVEDENDRLTRENERQRNELNATTAVVDGKDAAIAAAKATIEDLKDEISRIKGEKNIGLIEEDVHEAELEQLRQQHRASMQAVETAHDQQQKNIGATILRAHEGMRRREARIQKTHREEVSTLNQEIATLKSRLKASPVEPPAATIAEHRNAIRMLASQLKTANETVLSTRHTLAEAHKSLAVSTHEIDRLKKQFDLFKTACKKHYRDAYDAREQEWRKKMDAVLEDRKKIVKQLFIMWGREEMGIAPEGEKQPFRYKFVKKNGERIPQPGDATGAAPGAKDKQGGNGVAQPRPQPQPQPEEKGKNKQKNGDMPPQAAGTVKAPQREKERIVVPQPGAKDAKKKEEETRNPLPAGGAAAAADQANKIHNEEYLRRKKIAREQKRQQIRYIKERLKTMKAHPVVPDLPPRLV